jgi:hypothetical protein
VEEGSYFEASVLDGIENASPAGEDRRHRVKTKESIENDVPDEYLIPDDTRE